MRAGISAYDSVTIAYKRRPHDQHLVDGIEMVQSTESHCAAISACTQKRQPNSLCWSAARNWDTTHAGAAWRNRGVWCTIFSFRREGSWIHSHVLLRRKLKIVHPTPA